MTTPPPIDPDRLWLLADRIADRVALVPEAQIIAAMPPAIAAVVKLARGWPLRLDLVDTIRGMAIASLRGLPALAADDPDRAAAIVAAASGGLEWLTRQRDDLPPLPL